MINFLIEKSYTNLNVAKFTNIILLFIGSYKQRIKFLLLNITHYNIFNPKLFLKTLKEYKCNQSDFNILYDTVIRLYLLTKDNSFFFRLDSAKTAEKYPFEMDNFVDNDYKNIFIDLINTFKNNLNNGIIRNYLFEDSNSNETPTVEINFPCYILDKNSPLNEILKNELVLYYKSVINICKERNYKILPIFTYKWLVDYKSSFDSDLVFLHHSKINNKNQIILKRAYLMGFYYLNNTWFSGGYQSGFKGNYNHTKHDVKYEYIKQTFVDTTNSKYLQSSENFVKTNNKKIIFVALQTVHDVVAQYAYINTFELLKQIVNFYKNNDSVEIVIKRHPCCDNDAVKKYLEKISKYKNIVITNANIQSIIKISDVVCVCNSGVGFEALLQLNPVITTGKCDYSNVTYSAKNSEELKLNVSKILNGNLKYSNETIINFIEYYLNNDNIQLDNLKEKIEIEISKILK